MSPPSVSLILHGAARAAAEEVAHARAAAHVGWGDDVELIVASAATDGSAPGTWPERLKAPLERSPTVPATAAAVCNAARARATGDLLVFVENGCSPSPAALASLSGYAQDAGSLVLATSPSASPPADSDDARSSVPCAQSGAPSEDAAVHAHDDLADALRRAAARSTADLAALDLAQRARAWAIPAALFDRLHGLDERFGSVREVEDLASRAALAGIPVRRCSIELDAHAPEAWPLPQRVREFLAVRNRLLTAFATAQADDLGRTLATVATTAFSSAWRDAAIGAEQLRFGGAWGQRGRLDALLHGRTTARGQGLWPADEEGALVPLLALDSALSELIVRPARARAEGDPIAYDRAPQDAPPSRGAPVNGVPRVSVIVVNWNGREHLTPCFTSLLASSYPADRLELICVDNGSTDGSRELLASAFPSVRVVTLPENRGFTGGNEAGVDAASGDVFVFLNNDMRVEADAVARLVQALDETRPCAAARVLSWDGRRIDFVRGTINFEARGFQEHFGEPNRPELAAAAETFFPNGGAFAVTRGAYVAAGGFDPAFFAYYDDVDLGWGVRLAGFDVRVAGAAIVYHRHGATSGRHPAGQKRFLMERNAVWTVLKRYSEPALTRVFGVVLALAARRVCQEAAIERASGTAAALSPWSERCRRATTGGPARLRARVRGAAFPGTDRHQQAVTPLAEGAAATAGAAAPPRFVSRFPLETLAAVGEALLALPRVAAQRRAIQQARRAPDSALLPAFGRAMQYSSSLSSYMAAQDALSDALGLEPLFAGRTRVLLITHEPIEAQMSGPGIRVLEIGRALASTCQVTLATPYPPGIADDRCAIAPYSFERPDALRRLAEQADVLVVQGFTLSRFPFLRDMDAPIVVDLYCPFTIEHLEMRAGRAGDARQTPNGTPQPTAPLAAEAASILAVQNDQLADGDFFLCASERQRDFWIGALHTAGRINPSTYADDPTLKRLIAVVPFGLPDEPLPPSGGRPGLEPREPAMKGVRAGIGPDDRVLLWAGSLLDWQDPLTLIRAVARLATRRDDIKLFFMGTRHPNPQVPRMRAVDEAIALAAELDLLDRYVFFNDWVPYAERWRYLAEADVGLSTHRDHLETRLSFRTRMLDYVWAAVPIVCTDGDVFADLVRARGLGRTVPPGDADALSAAIESLLDDRDHADACRRALRALQPELRWTTVAEPLREFCRQPRFAADRAPAVRAMRARLASGYRVSKWMKRTALALGIPESRVEQLKQSAPLRAAMTLRNRVALARARARTRPAS